MTNGLIQLALLQALQPLIELTFSEHNHGFLPVQCVRNAVLAAQHCLQSGYRIAVDS